MNTLLLVELACLLGVVHGLPWAWQNRYGGYPERNTLRSLRSPWYRSQNTANGWIDAYCDYYNRELESDQSFGGQTERGYLCFKTQELVKILTYCTREELHAQNTEWLTISRTVLESRESNIRPCKVFKVTAYSKYSGGICFYMLINGVLSCVDEEELQPEYQTLTLYPTAELHGSPASPRVHYIICSTSASFTYCPGPAKVVSGVEIDEEFRDFECPLNTPGGGCLYRH